jgi:hypothetical protein
MSDMCCKIPVIALASLEVKFEVERSMAKIHILKPDPARKRLDAFVGREFEAPRIGAPERDVPPRRVSDF